MTMLRVKKGACAPLRLSSVLSRPATGITSMAVTTVAPAKPVRTACSIIRTLHGGALRLWNDLSDYIRDAARRGNHTAAIAPANDSSAVTATAAANPRLKPAALARP